MSKHTFLWNKPLHFFTVLLILATTSLLPRNVSAQEDVTPPNPAAEKYILDRVPTWGGLYIDLTGEFPEEKDRVVGAEFLQQLFAGELVKVPRQGIALKGIVVNTPLDLTYMEIPFEIYMDDSLFKDAVNMYSSKFTFLSLSGSTFESDVSFYQSEFSTLWMKQTEFDANADFYDIKVKSDFFVDGAKFLNSSQDAYADFSRMEITKDFSASGAHFAPVVYMGQSQVAGVLDISTAQFDNNLIVNNAHIGGIFVCSDTVFKSGVNAIKMTVDGQIQCRRTKFNSTDPENSVIFRKVKSEAVFFEEAVFEGKVDFSFNTYTDRVRFNKALFKGPVDFTSTQFLGGDVIFENTQFLSHDSPANFIRLEADVPLNFDNAVFSSGLDLSYANLKDLFIYNEQNGTPAQIDTLKLERAVINRELKLDSLRITSLQSNGLTVSGPAVITNVSVEGRIDLQDARFETLSLSQFSWPSEPQDFQLRGMTYKDINLGNDGLTKETFQDLLNIINHSDYSPQAYKALQQFVTDKGYPDLASQVEYVMRNRERSERLQPLSTPWLWSWFLFIFAGYGYMPYLAFIWSVLVVVIGSFVYYREENMVFQKADTIKALYHPLWYSFALFLPYISLDITNKWEPSPTRKWAYYYKYIHQLLGWVLLPIALLTFSGVI